MFPRGVARDRENTGAEACSTHAPGMRPGILTPGIPTRDSQVPLEPEKGTTKKPASA